MEIRKLLEQKIANERIQEKEPMAKHTTFQIGGEADFFLTIKTKEELQHALQIAKQYQVPFSILGKGSNLLVRDKGFRGMILKIAIDEIQIEKKENTAIVTVGAGMALAILARKLAREGIAGLEFACRNPGNHAEEPSE